MERPIMSVSYFWSFSEDYVVNLRHEAMLQMKSTLSRKLHMWQLIKNIGPCLASQGEIYKVIVH